MSFAIRNALSYSASPLPYLLRVGQSSAAFASSSRIGLDASFIKKADAVPKDTADAAKATPSDLDSLLESYATPSRETLTPSMTVEKIDVPAPIRRGRKASFKKPPHYEPEPKIRLPQSGPYSPDSNSTHTLTVTSTRNNTLLTFADRVGPCFPTISGGTDVTFKNSQRSSYEAAHQAALKTFERIREYEAYYRNGGKRVDIRVAFSGLAGQGREAVAAALSGPEGDGIRELIVRVEDRTPIKIGGTRARKARRL